MQSPEKQQTGLKPRSEKQRPPSRTNNAFYLPLLCALVLCQPDSAANANHRKRKPTHHAKTAAAKPKPKLAAPIIILAAKATVENEATMLDVTLNGPVKPTLTADGNHLALTLPRAAPDAQLGANLSGGGAVARIAMEMAPPPKQEVIFHIELRAAAKAELVPGLDAKTVRVRIADAGGAAINSAVHSAGEPGLYDIEATQSNVAELLKSLASDEGASVVMAGAVSAKVTVSLKKATFAQAFDLLVKSAGLVSHQDGKTFMVGTPKDMEAAFPKPQVEPPTPTVPETAEDVYRCRNISAFDLVATLTGMFDKDKLRVALGASSISPRLEEAKSSAGTGTDGNVIKGGANEAGLAARTVVLSGEKSTVLRALELARKLDVRRKQIKIDVKIADISLDALRELGVQWTLPNYSVHEAASSATNGTSGTGGTASAGATAIAGLNFGTFVHDPITISTQLSAMEQSNRSKLLASPNMMMLDGERAFILIGQRLKYPKLIGNSATQGPLYDTAEERVGIYLQVAAQVADNGEITLTLYPQISTVTGYLTYSGGSYPQISTREQQTTIRVKDGTQVVIGGLLRDDEIRNIQKVPFLANLPFFGELFTYRKTTRNKSDVVIMLHPTLLED